MKKTLWLSAILLLFAFNAGAQQCDIDCMCPDVNPDKHADQINAKLQAGQHAILCPNTIWRIRNTVGFNPYHPNTYLMTWGQPRDNSRAYLYADSAYDIKTGAPLSILIHMSSHDQNGNIACHGCQIRNIRVDGRRSVYGQHATAGSMVMMGGPSDGQIIDSVTLSNPRNAACLAVEWGPYPHCRNAQVTNSWFGPAGFANNAWSDGIQLQCRNSQVFYNEITDTTDSGIAIFGSPGSDVHHNRITAISRAQISGISFGDPGDYTGIRVHDNIINAQSAFIRHALPIGTHNSGACDKLADYISGGSVYNNSIQGANMGYGITIDGVTNFSVYGNTFTASYRGTPARACDTGELMPAPQRCVVNYAHSSGSFQSQCVGVPNLHGVSSISP